ncbi:MAG: TonB-dependent receptor plug domain-containing protein [Flavobacteriales bacterium]|nr:TonB-dependent receptor plug domain-containing protein [Flavobacteriales bacterium]
MTKRLLLLSVLVVSAFTIVRAQVGTGGIEGIVQDEKNNSIPFANVVLMEAGEQVAGTSADIDGKYKIKAVKPGNNYTLIVSAVGYASHEERGISITGAGQTFLNISMTTGVQLDQVVVSEYKDPLIKKDAGSSVTISGETITKMANRGYVAAVTTAAAVQDNDGQVGSIKGSRDGATNTYIDGVKVRGNVNLPQAAYEQVSVVTGGIPAQYGDATGGVISITTKGASRVTYGGIEALSSIGAKYDNKNHYLFDPQGYHLIAANISGPLISIKDKTDPEGKKKKPIMGYFLATEINYQKDPRPSAIGSYYVKDDVLKDLRTDPIVQSAQGASLLRSELIRKSDLQWTAQRKNVARRSVVASGNLDFYLPGNVTLKVGGNLDFNDYMNYSYSGSMFNSDNNGQVINQTWRVYGRFTQRFTPKPNADGEVKKTGITNAYYSIQADYSSVRQKTQDADHKANLFRYGYVGKFTTYKEDAYSFGVDNTTGLPGFIQGPDRDTMVTFQATDINPYLSAYTAQYYAQNPEKTGKYENLTQILQDRGAIRNGDFPRQVYNIWDNTGTQFNSYSILDQTQFRVMGTGSFDIKNHSIMLGFEYEQRSDSYIGYAPYSMWTLARQYVNNHFQDVLDLNNPIVHFDSNGNYTDTISYNHLVVTDPDHPEHNTGQYYVDYNIRKALGLDPKGTDWIDIDSYDPDFFKVNWFSASELLNNGNSLVSYYGYDYTGKKIKSKPTFDDFFNEKDEYGNFTRRVAAFNPIYMAGYIQDEFTFKDLIFRVGVRVDRYDANQKVLKDPYLLYEAYTAGQVTTMNGEAVTHPSNIASDAVVYVNDIKNPTAIVGYREGAVWYNAQGVEITDPSTLRAGTGIAPYLVDPNQETISSGAFKDYQPQVNVMPRISFSFPISDNSLFYANYDVLTQRPLTGNRLNLIDYLYLKNRTGTTPINNPDLKPSMTIEYSVGFKQQIGKNSAIQLNGFYREMRNQIATIRISEAYPKTYLTYGNIDFGTVKGLTVSYDLRRTKNIRLTLAYTLQFADGTGSNVNTGINLVNSGFPNLRVIQPLDFDQRHNIVLNFDYRFFMGDKYTGPKSITKNGKTINWLQGFGVNAVIRAGSGNPYSRQSNTTAAVLGGSTPFLAGSVNGSNKPWQFRIDMRVDKDITINWTKGKVGKKAKSSNLNVYVDFQNLLNTKNILSVYRKTGNPEDDGYLAAAEFQSSIAAQTNEQSFRDLYAVAVNNPGNYSLPRRVRLGFILNF